MNFWDKIKEFENRLISYDRDIKVDKLLNTESVEVSKNDQFIQDVRDHLSTCINRNEFTTSEYFLEPDKFKMNKPCECKVHIETKNMFMEFINTTYSMYRQYDEFDAEYILNSNLHHKLSVGERPIYCEDCGELEYLCECDD